MISSVRDEKTIDREVGNASPCRRNKEQRDSILERIIGSMLTMDRFEKKWESAERRNRCSECAFVSNIDCGEPPPAENQGYLVLSQFLYLRQLAAG